MSCSRGVAESHWLWVLGVWALVTAVTMVAAGAVLLSLPPESLRTDDDGARRRWPARLARNAVGVILVALGVVLSVPGVPGQGVLTILAGLTLIDFPGRRRAIRAIIGRPGVLGAVNRLRARFSRPPILPPGCA